MTTPLIGGRYVRDKKTGQLRRVPDEQASLSTMPADAASTPVVVPVETKGRTK